MKYFLISGTIYLENFKVVLYEKEKTKGVIFKRDIIIDSETGERKFEFITSENKHLIDPKRKKSKE